MKSGIKVDNKTAYARRSWVRRAAGVGLAGIAMTSVLATVAPTAAAGAATVHAPVAATAKAAQPAAVPTTNAAPVVVLPTASIPIPALPAGALDRIPGRHTVASPEVIGQSTAVGAALGAVIGFGVGFIAAPAIGVIGTAVVVAGTALLCTGATAVLPPAGVGCVVLLPLAAVIAAPLATIGAPIIGAVIGGVIGGAIGAGIGASYASAPAPAPKGAAKRVAATNQGFVAPKFVTDLAKDKTVGNIANAVDKATKTNPQLKQIRDFGQQFLPQPQR